MKLLALSFVWLLVLLIAAGDGVGAVSHQRHKHRRSWHYSSKTPLATLNRARVVTGDDVRLLKVVDKLLRGEPVAIAWLGTSLSMAYYGIPRGLSMAWPYIFHRWLETTFTSCGDIPDLKHVMDPWAPYVDNGGHVCTGSTVNMTNLSVFATTPNFMESCKLHKIPRDVDLVVLEMAVNDGFETMALGSASRRALERVMRYVLKMPSHPALLLFETYSWRHASRMEPPVHTGPAFTQTVEQYRRFGYLAEDDHMVLAQYYGNVQVLSARPVVYHSIMAHPENRHIGMFMNDDIHLEEPGHILYADILISYFRQYARNLVPQLVELSNAVDGSPPLTASGQLSAAAHDAGPTPHDGTTAQLQHAELHARAVLQRADRPFGYLLPEWQASSNYSYVPDKSQTEPGDVYRAPLEPWLPPPLNRGNHEVDHGMCHYGPDLKPFVVENDGFVYTDESNSNRDKFGFVAMEVGKRLVIRVDATLGGVNKDVERSTINVLHLESYEGMGYAELRCISGCRCEPQKWDSLCERKWSYTYPVSIDVTPHPDCHLEIRTVPAPDQRTSHKVKIIGVAVMGGDRMRWDLDLSLSIERYERNDQLV